MTTTNVRGDTDRRSMGGLGVPVASGVTGGALATVC